MTPKTHKIETAGGTVTTRTAAPFIAIRYRATSVFVAHAVGRSWIRVAVAFSEAEAREKAAAEIARRGIEAERIEVSEAKPFAEVVKRSASFETARRAAMKGEGVETRGFVYVAETGERRAAA